MGYLFLFSKFCSSDTLFVSSFVDFSVILGILKSSRELDTGGTIFASGIFGLSLAALGFDFPPLVPAGPFSTSLSTSLALVLGANFVPKPESESDELELRILLMRLPLLFLLTTS